MATLRDCDASCRRASRRTGAFRFSLKFVLGFFALVALLVYVTNTTFRYGAALEQYQRSAAIHELGRITTDQLIDDTVSLYTAESALLWKSRGEASLAHQKRLEWMLERQESKRCIGLNNSYDAIEAAIYRIRTMIAELESQQ
jgi:hypothetical protein